MNILVTAARCHAEFMAINAKLADQLRTADDAGAPDYTVASMVGGGNGITIEVLYAKTAEGAVGYSYQLPDGGFAKVEPATGDIITNVLAQGQLQNIKDRLFAALDDYAPMVDCPDDEVGTHFELLCEIWLKEYTNFSTPAQLFIGAAD